MSRLRTDTHEHAPETHSAPPEPSYGETPSPRFGVPHDERRELALGFRRRTAQGNGPRQRSARLETAVIALLVSSTVLSALAVGGAPPSVVLILSPLAMAAALASTWLGRRARDWARGPFFLLAALTVFTLVEAIPLPLKIVSHMSPFAADIWSRCLLASGRELTSGSLSLDPGATRLEALKWLAYTCTFAASATIARRRGVTVGAATILLSGTLVAIATIGHQLLDAKRIFGIYEPVATAPLSPFLNANNLAGYLNVAIFCGLGLLFSTRKPIPRPVVGAAVAILVAVSVRAASRAGMSTLIVGLVFFCVITLRSKAQPGGITRLRALGAVASLVTVAAVIVLVGGDRGLVASLSSEDLTKLRMSAWARPLISDFKWTGVGRGAFESVFSAYHPPTSNHVVFTHPENFVVQWLSEWGVAGGIALAAFGIMFRPTRFHLAHSTLQCGAIVALGTLFVQNLADLSLELYGVGVACAVLLGSLWGAASPRASSRGGRIGVMAIRALAVCGIPLLAFAAPSARLTVAADRIAVHALLNQRPMPIDALKSRITDSILRHPADEFLPLAGGIVAIKAGENPMPWLERALERGPYDGRTHLVLAEYLARRGVINQAMLELRLAVEYEPALSESASRAALETSHDAETLLRAAPEGVAGVPLLDALGAGLSGPNDASAREAIDGEIISRDPQQVPARQRLIAARLGALDSHRPPCADRARCEEEVRLHSEALRQARPESSLADQYLAKLEIANGDQRAARDRLEAACSAHQDAGPCYQLLADVEPLDDLPPVLQHYTSAMCSTKYNCAQAYDWVAQKFESLSQWARALEAREKAISEDSTPARFLAAASAAERGGFWLDAAKILKRYARTLAHRDDAVEQRIAKDSAAGMAPVQ